MKLSSLTKLFLGGTCGDSTWRNDLMPVLDEFGMNYFNPVVEDWNEDAQKEEDRQKSICDTHLYGLTKEQSGAYTFFEIGYSLYEGKKVVILNIDLEVNEQFRSTINKIIIDLKSDSNVLIFDSIVEFKEYLVS